MDVGKFGETTHEDAASGYRLCNSDDFHLSSIRYRNAGLPERGLEERALRVR
jgi:hypothetical protein